jgi:Transmembrane secretion effector
VAKRLTDGKGPSGQGRFKGPLRNPNFVFLWLGQSVSSMGNGMYTITLAWSVYSATGSSADMGLVLAANVVPDLAFTLFGGILADRIQRKTIIVWTNLASTVITAGLTVAAVTHRLDIVGILLASFALGLTMAFFAPAFSSIFKDVLAEDERVAGNSLRGVSTNVIRLVSPAIGGAVFAFGGAGLGFGLDALSFLIAAMAVLIARIPSSTVAMPGTVLNDVREGMAFIRRSEWLRKVIILSLVINAFCIPPAEVLLTLIVREAHHGASSLGTLLSVQAAFAAVASWVVGRVALRIRASVWFFFLYGTLAAGVAITGAGSKFWILAFVGVSLIGIGFACNVLEDIIMQSVVPHSLLGRVYSISILSSYALLPLGYAFAGIGASFVGASTVLIVGGCLSVFICIFLAVNSKSEVEVTESASA